ncbi:MAG: magnesium transporter [Oscillospiraceae bacterium]
MENNFDILRELFAKGSLRALRAQLTETNEVDIALFMEEYPSEKAMVIFRMLPKETASDVFANLEADTQQFIIESITDQELTLILNDLMMDDAVDMLEEMPANVVKRVLKTARPEDRVLLNQFLKYPENSTGSIMTAEFIELSAEMTVGEAISKIRKVGEEKETIYTCYVIDKTRILQGVVSVKSLLLSNDDQKLSELMETEIIYAATADDREETVKQLAKYDLLAMPVVDGENRLVGIVTVDDAVDVMEEEATEDFEKMAAMSPSDKPYLKTGVFSLAKKRIMWLMLLMVSGMLTGGILSHYEAAFATIPLLVTFIPMLTDTGGNAGSQSSTLIIRGMAVGEISLRDLFRVFWKELRVSLVVGVALAAVNFARMVIFYPHGAMMALTVSLAMIATVVAAKTVGGILPIFAKLCHADPAIMAAPLITTIVDAFSLIIYFSIAKALLPI